jgi:hypothetical protein
MGNYPAGILLAADADVLCLVVGHQEKRMPVQPVLRIVYMRWPLPDW